MSSKLSFTIFGKDKFSQAFSNLHKKTKGLKSISSSLNSFSDGSFKAARGVGAITAGFVGLAIPGIKLERQMSVIQSKMMGMEKTDPVFQKLSKRIKQLGRDIEQSATEVAKGADVCQQDHQRGKECFNYP